MVFNLFGNYVGVPISNNTGVYDVVKAGIIELLGGGRRQKIVYYPSKRDEAIVWGSALLEAEMWTHYYSKCHYLARSLSNKQRMSLLMSR